MIPHGGPLTQISNDILGFLVYTFAMFHNSQALELEFKEHFNSI